MKEIIKNQLQHTLNNSISDLESLGRHYRGKVRDNYYFDNQILMVTSDRVSAFDHVLGTIPFKGQILSDIASFWFNKPKILFLTIILNRLILKFCWLKKQNHFQ